MRYCIVNGDDFGATLGINRGILEAHRRGILTSASLMVDAPYAAEAAALSREAPALSVGLHAVFTSEAAEPLLDLGDPEACRADLLRQLEAFRELTGGMPTHLDSHHHVHLRHPHLGEAFLDLAGRHGLPLRRHSAAHHVGSFYGQEGWGETRLDQVGVESLVKILETLPEGVSELSCHPGYVDPELDSVYSIEREAELATLCDPALPETLRELGIEVIGFADLGRAAAG